MESCKEMSERGKVLTRQTRLAWYLITCLLVQPGREKDGSRSWLDRGPSRVDFLSSWSNASRNNLQERKRDPGLDSRGEEVDWGSLVLVSFGTSYKKRKGIWVVTREEKRQTRLSRQLIKCISVQPTTEERNPSRD